MRIGTVVPLSALVAGCALPSPNTAGPPSTEQVAGAEAATDTLITDRDLLDEPTSADADPVDGAGDESLIGRPPSDAASGDGSTGPEIPDGIVAGTDSSTPVAAAPIEPAVRDRLIAFGEAYLRFDYRTTDAARVEELRPFVAPVLLDELTRPIPAALAESLTLEERVVEAEFVDLQHLGDDTFLLRFVISTSRSEADVEEEQRTLLVSLDGRQLVSDVR